MKLLIAIDENKGLNSKLSEHFGHCSHFAIYETGTKEITIIKNKLEHSNLDITPVDQIMEFRPDIVFSLGIGQRAIVLFNKKGVKLRTGNYETVKGVIENINNLKKLNSNCNH
ncbi:hypothetical protein KAT36_01055 [Candidatus Pacearchaeota archaeon]|nr:hypothetical protein [Candidatus Pacearchaeota archaeon]